MLLFIILIIALFLIFPAYPYNRTWGYGPFGGLAFIVLLLFIWYATGHRLVI